jgi:hypothetical protein
MQENIAEVMMMTKGMTLEMTTAAVENGDGVEAAVAVETSVSEVT